MRSTTTRATQALCNDHHIVAMMQKARWNKDFLQRRHLVVFTAHQNIFVHVREVLHTPRAYRRHLHRLKYFLQIALQTARAGRNRSKIERIGGE
jgi:hypothetical protein